MSPERLCAVSVREALGGGIGDLLTVTTEDSYADAAAAVEAAHPQALLPPWAVALRLRDWPAMARLTSEWARALQAHLTTDLPVGIVIPAGAGIKERSDFFDWAAVEGFRPVCFPAHDRYRAFLTANIASRHPGKGFLADGWYHFLGDGPDVAHLLARLDLLGRWTVSE